MVFQPVFFCIYTMVLKVVVEKLAINCYLLVLAEVLHIVAFILEVV